MDLVFGLAVLLLLSILMIFKPEWMWKTEHFLSVRGGEPTDAYINYTRMIGVLFLLISVFAGLFSLVQLLS